MGTTLLVSINEALCDVKGNNSSFGEVNIIFAGDFAQLPPVGQKSLASQLPFRQVTDLDVQHQLFGKLLWYSVDTVQVLLTEIKCQDRDSNYPFVQLLSQL